MCNFVSAEAVKEGDEVRLYFGVSDRHTEIRKSNGIEESKYPERELHIPVEYIPVGKNLSLKSKWELRCDCGKPEWWTERMTELAVAQFRDEVRQRLAGKHIGSTMFLNSFLEELPANLRADHIEYYDDNVRLRSIQPGFVCQSLELYYCRALQEVPADMQCRSLSLYDSDIRRIPGISGLENLGCFDCSELRCIDARKSPYETFVLESCPQIRRLPKNLRTKKLIVASCASLEELPDTRRYNCSVDVDNCHRLRSMPSVLCADSITVRGCSKLSWHPDTLQCNNLEIFGLREFRWPVKYRAGRVRADLKAVPKELRRKLKDQGVNVSVAT